MTPRLLPILELVLASAIWLCICGPRKGNESLNPLFFKGLRFALGTLAILLVSLWITRTSKPQRFTFRPQFVLLGAVLFIAASLQQIGLLWTSAGSAGFITGLYVVFVPLIGLWRSQRPGKSIIAAVLFAVLGLWLINRGSSIDATFGNLLVLISALFWAFHVQLIDKFTRRYSSIELAVWQYLLCALFSLLSWWLGNMLGWIAPRSLNSVGASIWQAALPLLYGGRSVGIDYTFSFTRKNVSLPLLPASFFVWNRCSRCWVDGCCSLSVSLSMP
jgi:drug/metabolite transporter (DMT)-like permease